MTNVRVQTSHQSFNIISTGDTRIRKDDVNFDDMICSLFLVCYRGLFWCYATTDYKGLQGKL